jgi:glutamine amidotransferase
MRTVALIDAGGANLGSVRYALEREGASVNVVRDYDGLRDARWRWPCCVSAGWSMRCAT